MLTQSLLVLPCQWRVFTRIEENTQPGQLTPVDWRGVPCYTTSCLARKASVILSQDNQNDVVCLPKKLITCNGTCVGSVWTCTCWWEVGDECLLLCMCTQLLLYLLNCLYLNPKVVSLLPFWLTPTVGERVRGCVTFSCLPGFLMFSLKAPHRRVAEYACSTQSESNAIAEWFQH